MANLNSIFGNPLQKGASAMQDIEESNKALAAFNQWYVTLPKWTEEEATREAEDQINMDCKTNNNENK